MTNPLIPLTPHTPRPLSPLLINLHFPRMDSLHPDIVQLDLVPELFSCGCAVHAATRGAEFARRRRGFALRCDAGKH